MKKSKQEIKGKILRFSKTKRYENDVSPTEVTKNLFSGIWKNHVDGERTSIKKLHKRKLILTPVDRD
ncbi:hypothetical protein [Gracilimonas sp.]|uniref:hypothetical protein n=1 Tax=Gracilimonas sp. TaxID=1974203 RepID=UPI002871B366|nr:hypothetical protein [Gracilimonas sp.]